MKEFKHGYAESRGVDRGWINAPFIDAESMHTCLPLFCSLMTPLQGSQTCEYKHCLRRAPAWHSTKINLDGKHTVAEVWAEVDIAANQCDSLDQQPGFWGWVRLAFWSLGQHEKAVEEWLGLVPSDPEYLSSLCGGIKFIVRVMCRRPNTDYAC